MQILKCLGCLECSDCIRRSGDPSHLQAGTNDLRQTALVDHNAGLIERLHRWRRLVVIKNLPIEIAFDNRHAMAIAKFDDLLSTGFTHRAARRILECWHDIKQLWAAIYEGLFDLIR